MNNADAIRILKGEDQFEVIDLKSQTKMICKFIRWTHNNKQVLLRDVETKKDISVEAKMFLNYIGFFNE